MSSRFERNFLQSFYTVLESYMCNGIKIIWLDVRNIAKINPKMAKKQPFLDFFRISQKLSIRFERNFLQSFYTILESYMCNGIKIVWLGCDKHSQKPKIAEKQSFFDLPFSQKLSKRFERNFLQSFYTILESYMCNGIKIVWLDVRNIAKTNPKMAKKTAIFRLFSSFSKTPYEGNFLQSFYTILESHMCYVQWHQNRMAGM